MSRQFAALTRLVPVYADLENLFRLRALLLAAKFRRALQKVRLGFDSYLARFAYRGESAMPSSLPALASYRTWSRRVGQGIAYYFPIVCGGVGMDMAVRETSFRSAPGASLSNLRKAIFASRPSPDALSWVLPS
jgi:hypothetical protein